MGLLDIFKKKDTVIAPAPTTQSSAPFKSAEAAAQNADPLRGTSLSAQSPISGTSVLPSQNTAADYMKQGLTGSSNTYKNLTAAQNAQQIAAINRPAEIQPAQPKTFGQKIASSGIGRAVGDFVQGFGMNNPTGRDFETQSIPYQAGALANIPLAGAAAGVEGLAAGTKSIQTSLKANKVIRSITSAERAGATIEATGAIANVGDKIANTGKIISNTKQAKLIEQVAVSAAQKVSPANWRSILGLFKSNAGKAKGVISAATGVGGAALLSEMLSINAISDNVDRLGFAADTLAKAGDIEGANHLLDLQAEAVEFSQSFTSYIPFYQVAPSLSRFFKDQLTANELKREAINNTYEKEQAQLDPEGNYVPSDLEKARQAFYEGAGPETGGSLDEQGQFVPEPYQPKEYTDAVNEPGSTLGFGLLNTGGEFEEGKEIEQPSIQQLNGAAVDLFGVPYDQLSPQQKAFVDAQRGE
jgi:hypothetical protein